MSDADELNRTRTRDQSHATRAQEGVHPASRVEEDEWMQGRVDPEPRPGMAQRWVRIDLMSQADNGNVTRRFAEGWRPRPADTVPNIENAGFQVGAKGRPHAGCIIDRDRMLCEMPIERARKRERFYKEATDRMNEAVNQDIHKSVPASALALNARKSEVELGRATRRIPPVAGADE